MSMRARVAVTAGCVVAFLGAWSLVHHGPFRPHVESTDVAIYQSYAQQTLQGRIPYRDFSLEYPPGFLLPALAPRRMTSSRTSTPSTGGWRARVSS